MQGNDTLVLMLPKGEVSDTGTVSDTAFASRTPRARAVSDT
jgi:hypothetical protein